MMEKVQVEIFGQTYSLKGGADNGYIRELAAFIDTRMRDIQKGTGTADGYRLAILTALNIADELHRLKSSHKDLYQETMISLDRILAMTGDR